MSTLFADIANHVLDDATKQSLTIASDQIKQLMTVSTFAITFSIAFIKDIITTRDKITNKKFTLFLASIGCQLLSIIFGYIGLSRLTGLLINFKESPEINLAAIENTLFPLLQFLLFALGLLLTILFVGVTIWAGLHRKTGE